MAVTGIGGVFFRAADPAALKAWYATHLGVGGPYGQWDASAGPTLFVPFAADTTYFPPGKQWMINFRVSDLDAMAAKLADANIEVIRNPDWDTPETGRFVRLHDPEGNTIELWEPPSDDSSGAA